MLSCINMNKDYQNEIDDVPDEEVRELMESHDLDADTAERVRDTMDELGVDEDDAVELVEAGL